MRVVLTLTAILTVLALAPKAGASIESKIRKAFPRDGGAAVCIAKRESGLRPEASNGRSKGLFQIDVEAHPWVDASRIFDAAYNIVVARKLYLASWHHYGWRYRWSGPTGTLWTTHALCGV